MNIDMAALHAIEADKGISVDIAGPSELPSFCRRREADATWMPAPHL